MEKQSKVRWLMVIIVVLATMSMAVPALASEKVVLKADRIRYSVQQELLLVEGNAELISKDVTIRADKMQAIYRDGQVIEVIASGNVDLVKGDDTFHAEEFTYNVKAKTGFILEIRGSSKLEDSDETAYLSGRRANYREDYIEIFDGDMTTCDEDKPHYLFRAKRVEFYPDDKIKAWHMTFWEFNGKVPLLYWPYYVISLKEEDSDFSPQVGYSAATGFFIKTVYRYLLLDQRGELYMDYFQKTGPAGGFKQYYMDDDKNVGYVSVYLQKQDKGKSLPYLKAVHSQRAVWDGLSLNTTTTYNRYGGRESLSNSNTLSYTKKNNFLRWNGNFTGTYNPAKNRNTMTNKVDGKWVFPLMTLEGSVTDNFNIGESEYWEGNIKASKSTLLYNWSLFFNKKGNINEKYNFYTLPELDITLKPSGLDRKIPWKPYVAPFKYNTKLGYYIENASSTEALRWFNQLNYAKDFSIAGPVRLGLGAEGKLALHSTADWYYSYSPYVELKNNPIKGVTGSVKYVYFDGAGTSPFNFDRPANRTSQSVNASLNYNKNGLTLNTGTGYDLNTNKFQSLNNSASYVWGENRSNNISLTAPFDLEKMKFSSLTAKSTVTQEDLSLTLEANTIPSGFNPVEWNWTKLNSELDWKINEEWHIALQTTVNPSTAGGLVSKFSKGAVSITRNLHCRELSLSYDMIEKEVWLQYQITAFPKQKVRLGSNEEDRFQVDFDLGGLQ